MLQPNQAVYYTSSLLVQEATFLRYDGDICVLSTSVGTLRETPHNLQKQSHEFISA